MEQPGARVVTPALLPEGYLRLEVHWCQCGGPVYVTRQEAWSVVRWLPDGKVLVRPRRGNG